MMRTNRILILIVLLPTLALGAGVVAGVLATRLSAAPAPANGVADEQSSLAEDLGLSSSQRDQIRQIWEQVQAKVKRAGQDALDLQKQRDNDILSLLNDEQKLKFERISKDYGDRFKKLVADRDALVADAVEQTKKLLDDRQKERYAQILQSRVGPGGVSGQAPAQEVPLPPPAAPAK